MSCACEIRLGPARPSEPTKEELDAVVEAILKRKEQVMHYRNGREAKNGDIIVQIGGYGNGAKLTAMGVLHSAVPGNDHCNGNIAPIQNPLTSACLCDCLHIDDIEAMLKENGLDKRPSGK